MLDDKIISKEILAGQKHSDLLLPMIREILAEAGLLLTQLDGISFGAGPGSFTGVRIACGIAQGLAFATNLPVVGISTLKALAQKNEDKKIVVALDARMGEIYHAAYVHVAGYWKTTNEPIVCLPQQAPLLSGDDWIGCGSGFDAYPKELSHLYNGCLIRINYGLYPHAREIAQLAVQEFSNKASFNPQDAAPIYIRNKVALKENER